MMQRAVAKSRGFEWTAKAATARMEETAAVSVYKTKKIGGSSRPSRWRTNLPCGDAQGAGGGTPPLYTESAQPTLVTSLCPHQRLNGSSKSRTNVRGVKRDSIGSALLAIVSTPLRTVCASGRSRLKERTPPHRDGARRRQIAVGYASVAPSGPLPTTLGTRHTCVALRGQGTVPGRRCGVRTEPLRLMRRKERCNPFDS